MTRAFEDYQLKELEYARAYLARTWGQEAAYSTEPREVLIPSTHECATFYGLTHDTQSVCAVIRVVNEPFVKLMHYSQVVLVDRGAR